MPKHIQVKDINKVLNRIKNFRDKPIEKLEIWFSYLEHLKDMFFHPEKKPTEYYTFDYAEINRIIKHPDILLNFIGTLTTREELFQMENMFYQFMRCESIKKGGPPPTIERDRNGLPINKCGFIWDFYKNMLSYKKYTTRPSNNNGEGSRKKTRRKKTRRKKTRRKKTRKKRPNRYR
jgi:hypothetical protein